MNKVNLLAMADWLAAGHITQEQFDMESFRTECVSGGPFDETALEYLAEENFLDSNKPVVPPCGSVGCIVGWAPFTGIPGFAPLPGNDFFTPWSAPGSRQLDFARYSERVFGIEFYGDTWDYLFGAEWVPLDNTIEGAVARIRFAVAHPEIAEEVGAAIDKHDVEQYRAWAARQA